MRLILTLLLLGSSLSTVLAQNTVSAASDWKRLQIKSRPKVATRPASVAPTPATQTPAAAPVSTPVATASFTASASTPSTTPVAGVRVRRFTDNLTGVSGNKWKIGPRGDYSYEMASDGYRLRKRNKATKQTAFSYVPLPDSLNLNAADSFMVSVDVLTDPGVIPDGGLILGVKDSLNYCHVRINQQKQVSVKMVVDGRTYVSYLPGPASADKNGVVPELNTITVRRKRSWLHVYVNNRELSNSPFPYRPFQGNGVGVVSESELVTFKNLFVRTVQK